MRIGRRIRVVEPPNGVNINPGRIDHGPRRDLECLAALHVLRGTPAIAAAILDKPSNGCVVEHSATQVNDRPGQSHRQPGVVELTVGINDPATQPFGADRGDLLDDLIPAGLSRFSDPVTACEQVVELQSDSVERQIEPAIGRHDELAGVHQVRSIPQQHPTLLERLAYQGDVSLGQVAHAAVNQLGAAARGSLGEVAGFEQQSPIAPRRRVDGRTQARGPAADDDDVPRSPRRAAGRGSRFDRVIPSFFAVPRCRRCLACGEDVEVARQDTFRAIEASARRSYSGRGRSF